MKIFDHIDIADIPNALLIIDPETHTILDGNQHAKDLFGGQGKNLAGSDCQTIVCDNPANCPFRENNSVKLSPSETIIRKDGKDIHVIKSFHETVLDGKRYIIENIYDLQLLREAEIEIIQQEKHLKGIYENATVGMVLLDMNGNFFQVNKAFCEMLQYSEEELLSRKLTVTHPDDLESSEYILAQLRSGKISRNIMEKRYVRKDGQLIFVLHNASVMRDHEGNPLYFLIQAQDITYLKTALLKAMESYQLKTHFLQNLSHEVRTPANAIFGFWELMKSPSITESERDEYMNHLQGGVEQFMKIINDIVDMSKIETRQFELHHSVFDVNTMVSELHREYHRKFYELCTAGVDFTVFMPSDSFDLKLESDFGRVKQILKNLLDNAFKFTTFGQITIGCHILPEKEIILFVKDSGIGIPKEKLNLIFGKFRQGDESSTRKYGGLGLGLTLSKEIAELLGGRLWLTSEYGNGTSVFLALPYKGNAFAVNTAPMEKQEYDIPDLTGKTILIAEDVDNNFLVLDRFLVKSNARILRARNGLEAIEICRNETQIDLVLMDVQMPVINGYEATREILRMKPGIPVIAQTAYSVDFDEQSAVTAGCIAYMVKPLNMHEVFSLVSKYVTLRNNNESVDH
ncbi:MAG: PAS domain S-box protein [Bacteroidetes bacterium]|nr:PAS domain S-box protein [Bacteroidota bacterium]